MGIGEYSLEVKTRPADLKPAAVRHQGEVPGVIYGKEIEPVLISVNGAQLKRVYYQAGSSSLVNLKISGQDERTVLFKEPQFDPRTGELVHLDFYQVKLSEKIKAEVPLVFAGEAPAVEDFDGVLVTNKDKLEVECLPADLPHEITVDLSALKNIDDSILIKNVAVPSGVEVLDDAEEVVVVVTPQRAEEVEAAPVSEEEAVAGIEVASEKTAGGEAGEEKSAESSDAE